MYKKIYLKSLLLLAMMLIGAGNLWADDVVAYTLTPATGSNNNYASNCDITISGITWNLTGNSQLIPWRIGGKSLDGADRTLYSKTAISDNISKIEVTHGAASSITVNSWTVIVSKNSDFSSPVSTLTPTFAPNATTTITRPDGADWSNCYFKFVYNVTVSGSSNKFIEFSEAKFYKESGGNTTCATPTFSPAAGAVLSGTEVSINCSTSGATIYYTTDGTTPTSSSDVYSDPIEITEATTIKAYAAKDGYDDSDVAAAEYTIREVVSGYNIDFESPLEDYVDWTFENVGNTNTDISAHGGSKYGANINASGNGVASLTIQTKETVALPNELTCYVSKTSKNTTTSNWYVQVSTDGNTWTNVTTSSATEMTQGEWKPITANLSSYNDVYVRISYNGSTAIRAIDDISLTMREDTGKANPELSFDVTAVEVNLGEEFNAPLNNPHDLSVTYSSSDESVATVDNSGSVSILAAGTTTITASFAGNDEYNEGSASYTLTVVDPNAPGTENNPYTVAQARDAIDAGTGVTGVFAKGIVSKIVTAFNPQFGNISYNISEDGTEEADQLEAYRGFSYKGEWFTSEDDIQVGDEVVIYGNLTKYGNTYEFAASNQLVSLVRTEESQDPVITLTPSTIIVDAEEHNGTIAISLENLTVEDKAEFGVQYWNGNEPVEEIDWITVEIAEQDPQVGEGYVVSYTVAANDGPTRTAAFKVYVEGDEDDVWSDLVTITQAAYVAPPTPVEGSYVKVTSTDDITDGQYLIVYEGNETHDAVAFNGGLETLDAANNIIAVTIENDEIAASEATQAAEFTINVDEGTIKSASGLYIGKNANSNGLDANAETQYENTFAITNDEAVITASGGCTLRYNYASDQLRFRYYRNGQQAIQLYKFVSNEPEVEYYLAGSFAEDGWDEGMLKMTNKNGIYSVTKEIEAETEFKIVKKDVDGTTTWYGGEGEDTYQIHRDWCTDIVLVDGENFIINEAGEYTFSVNTTGTALTLSVDGFPAQQFFMAGSFNEWSATATQFEVGETEGVYTLTQELEAGAEFKVVSEGKWYGTTEPISAENCTALPLSDDSQIANMTVPAAGEYTFTLEKTPNGLFLSIAGFPEPVVKYYLAGSWNEWSEMVELAEQEDGSFVATQEFPANTEFKIVKDVDGEQTWYGGDTQGEGEVYGIHSEWCNDIALTAGDAGKNFIIEAEGNYTFTMNITDNGMFLSVAGWPVPVVEYALVSDASKLEAGKKILFVGENNGTYYAMGAQNNNNRAAAEVDVVDGKIIPGEGVAASTLVANEDGTWSFLTSVGYLYAASNSSNHLKSEAEINDYAKATISIGEDNLATILFGGGRDRNDLRFNSSNNPPIFSCYAESSNMNHVYIYMETSEEVIPETVTAEVSAAGLATFCSEWALDFTGIEEVYAYKVSVNEKQISYTRVYQVPAETGVVLRSLSGDAISVEVPVIESADEIADNALVAVLEAIESLPTNYDTNGYTNYILNNGSKGVGFYKANNQPVGAGKAYLQVEGTLSKDFIGFADGVATGIETIDNGWTVDNEIYDLQGRKVMNPTKGIFIQNGRKVVIK